MNNASQLSASLRELLGDTNRFNEPTDEQTKVIEETYNSPEVVAECQRLIQTYLREGRAVLTGAVAGALCFIGRTKLSEEQRTRCSTVISEAFEQTVREENLNLAESLYGIGFAVYSIFANFAWLDHLGPVPEE